MALSFPTIGGSLYQVQMDYDLSLRKLERDQRDRDAQRYAMQMRQSSVYSVSDLQNATSLLQGTTYATPQAAPPEYMAISREDIETTKQKAHRRKLHNLFFRHRNRERL